MLWIFAGLAIAAVAIDIQLNKLNETAKAQLGVLRRLEAHLVKVDEDDETGDI